MFASTQDLEFVQGQSRDVPDRELVLNNNTNCKSGRGIVFVSPVLSICQYFLSGPATACLLGVLGFSW